MNATDRVFYWVPRVICILAIIFLSMFAFDVFSPELSFWRQLVLLLLHLIPSFLMIAILVVAWKWEKTGGIILTIVGVIFFGTVFHLNFRSHNFTLIQSLRNASLLCLPFILAGILFIISHRRRLGKKDASDTKGE